MRRINRLELRFLCALMALTIGAMPALAEMPLPVPRPDLNPEIPQGNGPSVAIEDLARLKAEMARQMKLQMQRSAERQKLEAESSDLQSEAINLAARVQSKERAVSVSEDTLDVLGERESKILSGLKAGRKRLTDTLAALELLERQRPPALAVRPEDAADAVRSAILLSDIVPRLTAQADELSKQLKSLNLVRQRAAAEHKTLLAAAQELRDNQDRLAKIIEERAEHRNSLGVENVAEQERLAELGRRARSLSTLVEGLKEASRQAQDGKSQSGSQVARLRVPNPQGGTARDGVWTSTGSERLTFAEARGHLRLPVVGKVVEKFGVPNGSGGLTKGIKIGVRAGAQVVAPFDGRVKYAGPLKTYGNVLIVEAEGEYLIILAGMTHVDVSVGQWLLAGEPVGRMAELGEQGPKDLYLEFRRAREPFDPLPWLAGVTMEG